MLDEPKVSRHVREARQAHHVINYINDHHGHCGIGRAHSRSEALSHADVPGPVGNRQD
jgi:hypothetical protein